MVRSRRPPWGAHIFDSPLRQRIIGILVARGAVPLAELRQRLPSGWGSVHHHLETLEEAGLIRIETHAGRRVVVSQLEDVPEAKVRGAALLRSPALRSIARHIVDHPDCTVRDICDATGESRRVTYYHVKQLRDAGLLRLPTPNRYFELRATPDLARLLREACGAGSDRSPA